MSPSPSSSLMGSNYGGTASPTGPPGMPKAGGRRSRRRGSRRRGSRRRSSRRRGSRRR